MTAQQPSEPKTKRPWYYGLRDLRTKPTLQGLQVDPSSRERYPEAPEFVPWRSLAPCFASNRTRFFWCHDHALPLRERGWLALSVPGRRAGRVALRAWQRGMRHHITEPDFRVVRRFSVPHIPVVVGLVMSAICLGIIWFKLSGGITPTWRGEDWIGLEHASSYLILGRATVLLFLFMGALLLISPMALPIQQRLRPPLHFLSLGADGLVAVLGNGEQWRAPYRDLEGLHGGELYIRGRRPLIISPRHRDLQIILRELVRRHAVTTRPPPRWPKIHPWITAAVTSVSLSGLGYVIRPLLGESWPWPALAANLLFLLIPLGSYISARESTAPDNFRPGRLERFLSRRWRTRHRRRNG